MPQAGLSIGEGGWLKGDDAFFCRVGANANAGWRHEAQVLARCADHANVVTLYEVIEDAHYVYIVMEECEGESSLSPSLLSCCSKPKYHLMGRWDIACPHVIMAWGIPW